MGVIDRGGRKRGGGKREKVEEGWRQGTRLWKHRREIGDRGETVLGDEREWRMNGGTREKKMGGSTGEN